MRLIHESGLWSTGTAAEGAPLDAPVEVAGAVLSWTIDGAAGAPRITFTDAVMADWLWRVVGPAGHVALLAALADPAAADAVDAPGVEAAPEALAPLRRLAVGHWLRRWWPASARDGIPALDAVLLDAEVALLTDEAGYAFTDDTLDSDATELLGPHTAVLEGHLDSPDDRIAQLCTRALELADDLGCRGVPRRQPAVPRRDDYALAAGPAATAAVPAIAHGVASVNWAAVPPGVLDAAEDTVRWRIVPAGATVAAHVSVATLGTVDADGIEVRLVSADIAAAGTLNPRGEATLLLPVTEAVAWNHDWAATTVTVGADVVEPAEVRARIRRFARTRMAALPEDAFLAELLAAEAQY